MWENEKGRMRTRAVSHVISLVLESSPSAQAAQRIIQALDPAAPRSHHRNALIELDKIVGPSSSGGTIASHHPAKSLAVPIYLGLMMMAADRGRPDVPSDVRAQGRRGCHRSPVPLHRPSGAHSLFISLTICGQKLQPERPSSQRRSRCEQC